MKNSDYPTIKDGIDFIMYDLLKRQKVQKDSPEYVQELGKKLSATKYVKGFVFLEDIAIACGQYQMDADDIRHSLTPEEIEKRMKENPPVYRPDKDAIKQARKELEDICRNHYRKEIGNLAAEILLNKGYSAPGYYSRWDVFLFNHPNISKVLGLLFKQKELKH